MYRKSSVFFAVQLCLLAGSGYVYGREEFDPALLEVDNPNYKKVDLSNFEDGNQSPGIYHVDIIVNGKIIDNGDIEFRLIDDTKSKKRILQPCLSAQALKSYGVKVEQYPSLMAGNKCVDLSVIPGASAKFNFNSQQLILSFPQIAISQSERDYISPDKFDSGINALLLNYSVTGSENYARTAQGANGSNVFANLRPGLNVGFWRIRNYTTWSKQGNDGQSKWDTIYTYAQRPIVSLKSQLTLGESTSSANIFDSVPFRGAQLASDDDMRPESLRGYAPTVRGIAKSNARVIIRQNGYIIYDNSVSPGPFEITDLYPTGSGGDLNVTIQESDGSEQHMIVPFASLPILQRSGQMKYQLTGGQYRSYDHSVENTGFIQADGSLGLPYGLTLYGGGQFAVEHYQSLVAGIGSNLGTAGAISVDITQSWATQKNQEKQNGQSLRARYNKDITELGTYFALAAYRYSTEGFHTLAETLDTYSNQNFMPQQQYRKNRAELSVNQRLWQNAGTLSLSAISEDYWNINQTTRSIAVGYNNSWQGISYSMNFTHNINSQNTGTNASNSSENIYAFNISLPLDHWMHNTYVNYALNNSQGRGTAQSLGMNGTALSGNNLSWAVQQGYTNNGVGTNGNTNLDYRGTYGEVNTGYSYDKNSQRVNYGLSGGVVAHQNGVTLGQPVGETIALVKASGANDVAIMNQTGVKTDYRGYAIVPYMSPYRKNDVTLDNRSFGDDVEIMQMTKTLIPTRGAVVLADYNPHVGARALVTLKTTKGVIPFGATVTVISSKKSSVGIVGDLGKVYLSGLEDKGSLNVKWGDDITEQCVAEYSLTAPRPTSGVYVLSGLCK